MPSFATVSSTFDDTAATSIKTFPSTRAGGGIVRPAQKKYCCAMWVDYRATIIRGNANTSYLFNSTYSSADASSSISYTSLDTNTLLKRPFPLIQAPLRILGEYRFKLSSPPTPNPPSTNGQPVIGDQDGHELNCPAGFLQVSSMYVPAKALGNDPLGAKRQTRDYIYCAPIRQYCQWIVSANSDPNLIGAGYTAVSSYGTGLGVYPHYAPTPQAINTSTSNEYGYVDPTWQFNPDARPKVEENTGSTSAFIVVNAVGNDYLVNSAGVYNNCQ